MNVLDVLNQEIKNKHWSLEEKARYIYLKSCELFAYDSRYVFCDFIENGKALQCQINERTFDLKNVQDNRVICYSHTKEILASLLQELLDLKVYIKGNKFHTWLVFEAGKNEIEADATLANDLSRVKMGLDTKGYKPNHTSKKLFLQQMDQQIGYIEQNYQDSLFENRKEKLLEEYKCFSKRDFIYEMDTNYLRYKLDVVQEIFKSYSKMQEFSDCKFCVEYLLRHLLDGWEISRISSFSLFRNCQDKWDFLAIYQVKLFDDFLYYGLRKEENGYEFIEISYADVLEFCHNYQGRAKSLLIK